MSIKNVKRLLPLLVLSLSLTACATKSPAPLVVQSPRIPPPPTELMEPLPSHSYSENVQQLLQKWGKKLTGSKE